MSSIKRKRKKNTGTRNDHNMVVVYYYYNVPTCVGRKKIKSHAIFRVTKSTEHDENNDTTVNRSKR